MGKQGSPRSQRPEFQNADFFLGMGEYNLRGPETLPGSDPSIGRRISWGDRHCNSKTVLLHGLKHDSAKYTACKGVYVGRRYSWLRKHVKSIAFMVGLMSFILLFHSIMMSIFYLRNLQNHSAQRNSSGLKVNISCCHARCPTLELGSDAITGLDSITKLELEKWNWNWPEM